VTLGTKTLLFGVHQFFIHPLLVIIAWVKLYRSFPSWRELLCIAIHDWGYWGVVDLKGAEGDRHPEVGARIATRLLGPEWGDFILGHSSFYSVRNGVKQSKLLAPDKYWHCMIPLWFFKILSVPTGELRYYRTRQHARQVAAVHETDEQWWAKLQQICLQKIDGAYLVDTERLAK
jgi:hypothetical protein